MTLGRAALDAARSMLAAGDIEELLDGFDAEIEAAIADLNKPKGGQQAGVFRGDFARCSPRTLEKLKWWSRAFRDALRADRALTSAHQGKGET